MSGTNLFNSSTETSAVIGQGLGVVANTKDAHISGTEQFVAASPVGAGLNSKLSLALNGQKLGI